MCNTRTLDLYVDCLLVAGFKPASSCLPFQGLLGHDDTKTFDDAGPCVFVQTQEKGSYRVEDVLEFLDWWLPVAEHPQDSLLVMLDWFSAHLHEKVQQLVHRKGHLLDYHGGGTTPIEQVNDTHIHAALSRDYKILENEDALRQRSVNSKRVPRRSRQIIVDDITQI